MNGTTETRPNKDARVGGKRKWSLVPLAVFGEIVDVMQWAIERETPPPYARDSWRDLADWRELYAEALLRHLTAWQGGEERDPESGKLHAAHIGACAVILLARSIEGAVAPKKRGRAWCVGCGAKGPVATGDYQPSDLCPDCAIEAARAQPQARSA